MKAQTLQYALYLLCRFLLVKTSPCRICSCIGDVIDCDKRGLTGFHVAAAFNSTKWKQLLLAHNKLTHVPDLSRFSQLRKLDLSRNRITVIPADAFSSLASLTELDLSMNMNFQLSDTGLPSAVFSGLKSLEILRMKQVSKPMPGFDYQVISKLNATLKELYIVGIPDFSLSLSSLTKLHTLSLGGENCDIPLMAGQHPQPITELPLERLSARFCQVEEISSNFLQHFSTTLERLDLSSNNLRADLTEIFLGVSGSKLKVLLLDNINTDGKAQDTSALHYCPWHIQGESFSALNTASSLQVLSLRANHISERSEIELRLHCPQLLYLDLSYNLLRNCTDLDVRTNTGYQKLNSPSLRFLGLGNNRLVQSPCPNFEKKYVNWNEDSYLFTDELESFNWNFNRRSDISDPQSFTAIAKEFSSNYDTYCGPEYVYCLSLATFPKHLRTISQALRKDGAYAPNNNSIDRTYSYITGLAHFTNLREYLHKTTSFPPNLTSLIGSYHHKFELDKCKWSFFPNNLVSVDLSDSDFGEVLCNYIKGLPYLTNLTCHRCNITGWDTGIFTGIHIQNLSLAFNHLGNRLKTDREGLLLKLLSLSLTSLNIANQYDGFGAMDQLLFLRNTAELQYLYLQGNSITVWNVTLSSFLPNLLYLDISDNHISHLAEHIRQDLTYLHQKTGLQVFMAGNEVDCRNGESSYFYLEWLLNNSVIVDTHDMHCAGSLLPILPVPVLLTPSQVTQGPLSV